MMNKLQTKIDLKLTKAEIIDILLEDARVEMETRLAEITREMGSLLDKYLQEQTLGSGSLIDQWLETLDAPTRKSLKAVQRALDKLYAGAEFHAHRRPARKKSELHIDVHGAITLALPVEFSSVQVAPTCAKRARAVWTVRRLEAFRDNLRGDRCFSPGVTHHNEEIMRVFSEEDKSLFEALRAEYTDVSSQLSDFDRTSSRCKIQLLKKLLSMSEEGQGILDLLESVRTGNQFFKKLNK